MCELIVCCGLPSSPRLRARLKPRSRCQGGHTQLGVGNPGTSLAAIRLTRGRKTARPTTVPVPASCDGSLKMQRDGPGMLMISYKQREEQQLHRHQQHAEETSRGRQTIQTTVPEREIQNHHVHLVPIGPAGFIDLAARAWLASCLSSLFSLTWSLGPSRGRQRASAWTGPWGPGVGSWKSSFGVGAGDTLTSTPNDAHPLLVRQMRT